VSNVVVDALSRRDVEATTEVSVLSALAFTIFDNLRAEVTTSLEATQLLEEVTMGTRGDQWCIIDGLVTHRGRVYVPPTSLSLPKVLAAAHGLGHEGTEKTLHRLRVDFHVLGARAMVRDFVWECRVCQRNKTEQLHPAGLMQPLVVPPTVWAGIAIDFVEGLHKIKR
jgi:hypothetical protein